MSQLPAVTQAIRDRFAQLPTAEYREGFLAALRHAVANLQTVPHVWGDPLYPLHHPGGHAYHAMRDGLSVFYVVFEPERKVLIRRVRFFIAQFND